jgi:hypothetical protein
MSHSYEIRVELIAEKAKQMVKNYCESYGSHEDFIKDISDLKKQVDLAYSEAQNDHGRGGER